MQPTSPLEVAVGIFVFILIMAFSLVLVIIADRSANEADRQKTERERIRHMPKSVRERRLLIRREHPDGSYHDLSLDTLSLGSREHGIERLPENKHKQLHWQTRNHGKTGREVVIYRRHYPSKPRKFYQKEE